MRVVLKSMPMYTPPTLCPSRTPAPSPPVLLRDDVTQIARLSAVSAELQAQVDDLNSERVRLLNKLRDNAATAALSASAGGGVGEERTEKMMMMVRRGDEILGGQGDNYVGVTWGTYFRQTLGLATVERSVLCVCSSIVEFNLEGSLLWRSFPLSCALFLTAGLYAQRPFGC